MKLLVIGGTSFIGLHVVESALAAGHEVTMFNRGVTNPDAFPQVEHLTGDRERTEDLDLLRGRDWDAVVDTCGFDYRVVERSSEILSGHVGHYTFISSIAVYADFTRRNDEDSPKVELKDDPDKPRERAFGGSSLYAPMKVLSEGVIAEAFPEHWATVRPSSVSGPQDHGASNRRTGYWAARVRDYEQILVPGPPDRLVSYIDARDMAAWIVGLAAAGTTGAFNAVAPPLTIERFIELAEDVFETTATAVWADPDWLLSHGIKPNVALPWWVPSQPCMFDIDGSKAIAAGLAIRPIGETIRDSAAWEDVRPPTLAPQSPLAGQGRGDLLSRERELELIALWGEPGHGERP
jgi:2'-hydroxyisoflavone reductase